MFAVMFPPPLPVLVLGFLGKTWEPPNDHDLPCKGGATKKNLLMLQKGAKGNPMQLPA